MLVARRPRRSRREGDRCQIIRRVGKRGQIHEVATTNSATSVARTGWLFGATATAAGRCRAKFDVATNYGTERNQC